MVEIKMPHVIWVCHFCLNEFKDGEFFSQIVVNGNWGQCHDKCKDKFLATKRDNNV